MSPACRELHHHRNRKSRFSLGLDRLQCSGQDVAPGSCYALILDPRKKPSLGRLGAWPTTRLAAPWWEAVPVWMPFLGTE